MSDNLELALKLDRLMRTIHANLHPRARDVDRANVGPFGGMILMAIADGEPVSILSLVEELGRDKSQMSRAIQGLERKQLVSRESDENDNRISLIRLTDDGRKQVTQFQLALESVTAELFDTLDEAELDQFSDLLAKILRDQGSGEGA